MEILIISTASRYNVVQLPDKLHNLHPRLLTLDSFLHLVKWCVKPGSGATQVRVVGWELGWSAKLSWGIRKSGLKEGTAPRQDGHRQTRRGNQPSKANRPLPTHQGELLARVAL